MISDKKSISGAQCRAARALLDWTREDLARESKVSRATIADFETGKRPARERTTDDLQQALEAGGIEFTPENGGGAGVRFRKPGTPAAAPSQPPTAADDQAIERAAAERAERRINGTSTDADRAAEAEYQAAIRSREKAAG